MQDSGLGLGSKPSSPLDSLLLDVTPSMPPELSVGSPTEPQASVSRQNSDRGKGARDRNRDAQRRFRARQRVSCMLMCWFWY